MSAGLYLTEVNINTVCELGGGAVSLQVCSSRLLSPQEGAELVRRARVGCRTEHSHDNPSLPG